MPAFLNVLSIAVLIVACLVIGGIRQGARQTLHQLTTQDSSVRRIEIASSQSDHDLISSELLDQLKLVAV